MARYIGHHLLSLKQKLLNKMIVNPQTQCWEWQAATNNIGYGFIRADGKMRTAHRVSYEQHIGPIPAGKIICHSCDNKKCINPDHLWAGTVMENMRDMINKGRANKRTKGDGFRLPRTSCEHCNNNDIPINIYARNHGDKCKHKP